ncbi:MAG: TIR domain-containing protein [Eubacteriales bacterium]|nr:TIR domain-containing protein [Eubacteriales bacterium]
MNNHFAPYEGNKPYIFMSYAHADAEKVLPVIKELNDRHYRVWYDTGIEAGANWPEVIAGHLSGASCVLFFISEKFLISQNCAREVNFTVDMKLPMAALYLDNAELPPGMKMQLSQAVSVKTGEEKSPSGSAEALLNIGAFPETFIGDGIEGYNVKETKKRKKINAGMVVGIIGIFIAICAVAALIGLTQGWFSSGITKETVAVSGNSDEENEILEVTRWTNAIMRDLLISQADSAALYACGNAFVTSRSAISYSVGQYRIAGETVEQGDISNLKPIADNKELVELALCFQQITDISALKDLKKLQYLDLSGNEIDDISPASEMDSLRVLKLCHTNVTDLKATLDMKSLEKLYISFDMVEYAKIILNGDFEVVVTE